MLEVLGVGVQGAKQRQQELWVCRGAGEHVEGSSQNGYQLNARLLAGCAMPAVRCGVGGSKLNYP
jgi:hypothetical protein